MFFYEKYLRSLRIPRESFVALISFMAMAMPWAVIAADSYTWTGGGANNNWNTAANWGLASGSPNAVDATINFGASSRYTPNLNRNTTIGYFVIDSATQYSINGNGMRRVTLDVSSGNAGVIIGGGGGVTHIYNKQMIWNDHVDIDVAADTGFTFADTISGSSSGFTKTGAGTLNLADQNSFTGGISLLGGVVSITADNRLGNVANDITFDGGMLQTTGAFTFNAGRTFTFDQAGGGFNNAANLTFGTADSLLGSGAMVKQGAGTMIISQANNGAGAYSGDLTVEAGSLNLDAANALGLIQSITLNGNNLQLGASEAINNSASINLGTSSQMLLSNYSETFGALNGSGAVALGTGSINVSSGEFIGTITGSSGSFLTKRDSGVLSLGGNSST